MDTRVSANAVPRSSTERLAALSMAQDRVLMEVNLESRVLRRAAITREIILLTFKEGGVVSYVKGALSFGFLHDLGSERVVGFKVN